MTIWLNDCLAQWLIRGKIDRYIDRLRSLNKTRPLFEKETSYSSFSSSYLHTSALGRMTRISRFGAWFNGHTVCILVVTLNLNCVPGPEACRAGGLNFDQKNNLFDFFVKISKLSFIKKIYFYLLPLKTCFFPRCSRLEYLIGKTCTLLIRTVLVMVRSGKEM